jgi:hypothetical protein
MATSRIPAEVRLRAAEREEVVLIGPPERLVGELCVHNQGTVRARLRGGRLRSEEVCSRTGEEGTLAVSFMARLRAGQSQRIPVEVAVASSTPPGEYRGEIVLGEERVPATLHVQESVKLLLQPASLVVEALPGQTVRRQVMFTNRGNVPLPISRIGSIAVEDQQLECRVARRVLLELASKEVVDLDTAVAEIARQTKRVEDELGVLQVNNEEFTLAPGEVRKVELAIRSPRDLPIRGRFTALAAIWTENLRIMVFSQGGGGRADTSGPRPKKGSKEDQSST